MNLSPHFTLAELTRTDHRKFDNTPGQAEIANLTRLAQFLELCRTALGDKPMVVTSAYRSKAVNSAVGSKDTSQHRTGCAADFIVPGITPDLVVKTLIKAGLPYDQIICEFNSWTHISIPNKPDLLPRYQALVIDRQGTRIFA